MPENQTRERARRKDRHALPAVSAVVGEGSLAEMVIDPERKRTGFAVWRNGDWSWVSEVEDETSQRLEPFAFDHALLRGNVVLFAKQPEEYGSWTQLVQEVRAFLHRYVGLSESFERVASHYVLFTWVYDRFNEVPYLRAGGDYGSGKTRFLQAIGSICYRSIFASGASTVSPIFHMLDLFGGTLVIDEADFRASDEKADMVKILNNGNVRGMPVLRAQATRLRDFEPRVFQVFGPKIVAMRGCYDDRGLESRFLTEEMSARSWRDDIPVNLPARFEKDALALRNKLLMYRFRNRDRCEPREELVDRSLEPRLNQVLVPLLSVIEDSGERDAVRRLARRHFGQRVAKENISETDEYRWEPCA